MVTVVTKNEAEKKNKQIKILKQLPGYRNRKIFNKCNIFFQPAIVTLNFVYFSRFLKKKSRGLTQRKPTPEISTSCLHNFFRSGGIAKSSPSIYLIFTFVRLVINVYLNRKLRSFADFRKKKQKVSTGILRSIIPSQFQVV